MPRSYPLLVFRVRLSRLFAPPSPPPPLKPPFQPYSVIVGPTYLPTAAFPYIRNDWKKKECTGVFPIYVPSFFWKVKQDDARAWGIRRGERKIQSALLKGLGK